MFLTLKSFQFLSPSAFVRRTTLCRITNYHFRFYFFTCVGVWVCAVPSESRRRPGTGVNRHTVLEMKLGSSEDQYGLLTTELSLQSGVTVKTVAVLTCPSCLLPSSRYLSPYPFPFTFTHTHFYTHMSHELLSSEPWRVCLNRALYP